MATETKTTKKTTTKKVEAVDAKVVEPVKETKETKALKAAETRIANLEEQINLLESKARTERKTAAFREKILGGGLAAVTAFIVAVFAVLCGAISRLGYAGDKLGKLFYKTEISATASSYNHLYLTTNNGTYIIGTSFIFCIVAIALALATVGVYVYFKLKDRK